MGKTPKKQDVIERAFELHHKKNYNVNANNPEVNEVKESGFYEQAKCELMRSEDSEYVSHIEKEARTLGLIDNKIELGRQRKPFDFEIDLEEALRSGVFISGGRGTTKSNLAMLICDRLMKKGIVVKAFDISRAWQKSSIPYYVEVESKGNITVSLYESCVFDLSKLTPKEAKDFISKLLDNEWKLQISIPEEKRKPIVYIFEEVQLLVPQWSLRGDQYVLRLMTTGRNFKLGFVAITQRPALCDTSVFELSFQRYFARMDGENDKKKVASYIGIEKARRLENLRLGEFIYDMGTQTKWITTKEFRANVKPQKSSITQFASSETKREAKPNVEAIALLLSLMAFAFLVGALLV